MWLWEDWPDYWGVDCGIDLIARDISGKIWAIQAKCYDSRYSVTKTDVDKFLNESDHPLIHLRLLIATTDKIGPNAQRVIRQKKDRPVSQLLRCGLQKSPVDWPANPRDLAGGGPKPVWTPRPHQKEAIESVKQRLGARGQLLMACGTGKTLTALWIAEALKSEATLVLLPSLTLLSQTVVEWLANAQSSFAYLPVCSDETVAANADSATMFTSELAFPVTTQPVNIASFLNSSGPRVVFSTYQSSQKVAEAMTICSDVKFDLVIADEAHRCAGKVSSDYGTVLDDALIPAKKSLFMTATPRTFTDGVVSRARDADIVIAVKMCLAPF